MTIKPERIEAEGVSLPLLNPEKNDSALRAAILNFGGLSDEQKASLKGFEKTNEKTSKETKLSLDMESKDLFEGIGRLLSGTNLLQTTSGMSDEARKTVNGPLHKSPSEGFGVYDLAGVASGRNLVIFHNPEDKTVIAFLPIDLNINFRPSFEEAMKKAFGGCELSEGLTDGISRVYMWGGENGKVREDFRKIEKRAIELGSKRVNL